MKYNLNGFSQEMLLHINSKGITDNEEKHQKLDCIDIQILNWFFDFFNSDKLKQYQNPDNGIQYKWLFYDLVLKTFPFLDLKKQAIAMRFKKYKILKILDHYTFRGCGDSGTGVYSCFYVVPAMQSILYGPTQSNADDPSYTKELYERKMILDFIYDKNIDAAVLILAYQEQNMKYNELMNLDCFDIEDYKLRYKNSSFKTMNKDKPINKSFNTPMNSDNRDFSKSQDSYNENLENRDIPINKNNYKEPTCNDSNSYDFARDLMPAAKPRQKQSPDRKDIYYFKKLNSVLSNYPGLFQQETKLPENIGDSITKKAKKLSFYLEKIELSEFIKKDGTSDYFTFKDTLQKSINMLKLRPGILSQPLEQQLDLAFSRFNEIKKEGSSMTKKKWLPKDLLSFIFNESSGYSFFIQCISKEPVSKSIEISKEVFEEIPDDFLQPYNEFLPYLQYTPGQAATVRRHLYEIWKYYDNLDKKTYNFRFLPDWKHLPYSGLFQIEHAAYLKSFGNKLQPGHFDPDGECFKQFLREFAKNKESNFTEYSLVKDTKFYTERGVFRDALWEFGRNHYDRYKLIASEMEYETGEKAEEIYIKWAALKEGFNDINSRDVDHLKICLKIDNEWNSISEYLRDYFKEIKDFDIILAELQEKYKFLC